MCCSLSLGACFNSTPTHTVGLDRCCQWGGRIDSESERSRKTTTSVAASDAEIEPKTSHATYGDRGGEGAIIFSGTFFFAISAFVIINTHMIYEYVYDACTHSEFSSVEPSGHL